MGHGIMIACVLDSGTVSRPASPVLSFLEKIMLCWDCFILLQLISEKSRGGETCVFFLRK